MQKKKKTTTKSTRSKCQMRKEDGTAGAGKMCYFLDQCQSLHQEQSSRGTDMQYETRLFVRLMLNQLSLNAKGRTKSFYSSTEGQANAH